MVQVVPTIMPNARLWSFSNRRLLLGALDDNDTDTVYCFTVCGRAFILVALLPHFPPCCLQL